MKAIILCAGFGKRMKPYTDTYQKTMIPVHGKPLLEYLIEGIKHTGIKDIIIVVGYRKEQIIDHFQDGSKWGMVIRYVEQKELNGTGGALLLCENYVREPHFFLTWGDILVPYSVYKEVHDVFKEEKQDFILTTNYTDDPYLGCSIHCKGDFCVNMIEKPPKGKTTSNLNNCGVFILSKKVFKVLKTLKLSERGEIELPSAICKGIEEKGWKVRVIKLEKNVFRGDFGNLKEYERLNEASNWLKDLIK